MILLDSSISPTLQPKCVFFEGGFKALPCPGVLVLVTNFNGDARSHPPRTLYTLDGLFPAGRLFSGDQFWQ